MHTPTPPLCEKRLQTIENKRRESEKERQEKQRGGKILKTNGLWLSDSWLVKGDAAGRFLQRAKILGGNADGCENKGVVKKATQKVLKRKQ